VTHRGALMTIGDFSRATRLTAKALRLYHGEGLLVPADVDPATGYRRYAVAQLTDAQVIRSLRSLDVPIDEIRSILDAPDVASRAVVLADHAERLERQLRQTSEALRTLRGVLDPAPHRAAIEHRAVPATTVLGIEAVIDLADLGGWFHRTMVELRTAVDASGARAIGPFGGVWSTALFLDERGAAMLHVPIAPDDAASTTRGPARRRTLPAAELAVATSRGADDAVAATYAALGEHVAANELSVEAPVRETYLEGLPGGDADAVVEIGWPIFRVHA
jgi:DNA-binding transcriptional MerR regulator